MVGITTLTTILIGGSLASAAALSPFLAKRADGYNNPADNGGNSLGLFPGNANGEPLNVIISGASSAEIHDVSGFTTWANAIGFGKECFGLHSGAAMQADLGDGQGRRDQEAEFRFLYGTDPDIGACGESLVGGNHFRYWQQSNTQAWFLAASEEKNVFDHHDIVDDGYDKGRDDIVSRAQANPSYKGKTYSAQVEYITGFLPTGSDGINHGIALDGRTAVITIQVSDS